MSKKIRLFLILALIILIGLSSLSPAFAFISSNPEDIEQTEEESQTQQTSAEPKLYDKIIVCANKGNHADYPENSIEAASMAPCDCVSVDVKLTKDGVPVLMEDETVDRMCVDKNGKSVSGRVDSFTYKEISAFFLKERTGGNVNKTEYKVPSLSDFVSAISNKVIVADIGFDAIDAVLKVVNNDAIRPRIILRIDGKADKIIEKLSAEKKVPNIILKYNGNIIFSVNSAIKKAAKSGLSIIQLGTKNHHGVIFYHSVVNKIKKNGLTAVFSMTEPYNGGREDNVTGWDDVISRGYTFIETDHPDSLLNYASAAESAKQDLTSLIAKAEKYKDGNYPKDLKYEFSKAYQHAVSINKRAISQSQAGEASTRLSKAIEALEHAGSSSTAKSVFHFTPGRIITVVLCLAAVAAAQIYLFKRRHPKKAKEQ